MAQARWSAKGIALRIAALLTAAFVITAPAHARGWELCNQTSFIIEAAVGRSEANGVVVQGWTRIRPGQCEVALPAPLRPGAHFVFARSSKAHRGGQRTWPGDVPLCVDPNGAFAVESPASCSAVGLEQRGFQAVRIDKRDSAKTTFRETEPYDKGGQSVQAAGLQRLLDDAAVDAGVIDGYIGRRSRAAIANFLAERSLPPNTSDIDLIDILEDVARNRSLEVGMMLCNRTDNVIEAAMARRRPDGWESRGWWVMEAGACVRTVDEALIADPHFVFAEMKTPQGTRRLSGAGTVFCTSRSRFAVIGREDCEARRFRQELFAETAIPEDGKLVYEFFDRGFGPPDGGS